MSQMNRQSGTQVHEITDAPTAPADGEPSRLGRHSMRRLDTPHLPPPWGCGILMEEETRT